jgi:phage FluMu protein gp41
VHRRGVMRLATAMDEIAPLRDPRVKANEAYLTIILLSRVITQLGDLPSISTRTIENLTVADLAYLQDLYRRINEEGANVVRTTCPSCGHTYEAEVVPLGG